jgi:hypothetical protein
MGLAGIGTELHRARANPAPPVQATIGFTSPLTIEAEARTIDRAARTLLGDVESNLPTDATTLGGALRASYVGWFEKTWTPFFDSIVSIASNMLGRTLLGTDERFAELQVRRGELAEFKNKYETAANKPSAAVIPADPRTAPAPPPSPSKLPSWWPTWAQPPKLSVPWWVWVGGTVVAIGGGYLAYRSWQNQRRIQTRFIESLPRFFPETAPVVSAAQAAGHDVGQGCSSCGHGEM